VENSIKILGLSKHKSVSTPNVILMLNGLIILGAYLMGSLEQTKLKGKIIKIINGEIKEDWRPIHLKNPRTGKNLEVDIYLTKFNIGIEYQGRPHFKNSSDKSRLNDLIKSNIVLNHKKTFCLIEVFYNDLIGDFKSNFLKRIVNTQRYYLLNFKPLKAKRLEQLRLAILYDSKHALMAQLIHIWDDHADDYINVCYKGIRYLHALRKALQISTSKRNGVDRAMQYMGNLDFCEDKCICNNENLLFDLEEYFMKYQESLYGGVL